MCRLCVRTWEYFVARRDQSGLPDPVEADVHLSDCPHAVDPEHEVMCRFRKRKSESVHGHHPACRSCRRVSESGAVDAGYYSSGEESLSLSFVTATEETGVATEAVLTETSVLVLDVCAASSTSNSIDDGADPCEADPQHPDFPLATCLTCSVDTVPMVALECELPVSGRLSPPVDDASVAFLPMGSDLHPDAVLEVAVSDSGEVGEDHFSVTSRGSGLKRKRHQRNDCEDESFDVCDEQCVNSSQLRDRACHDQADSPRRGSHKKRRVDGGRCHADIEERDLNCDMEEQEVPDTTTTTTTTADAVVALVQDPPDSTDPTSTGECEDSLLASSSVTSGFKLPRISPFHNTPKQRKEERRRILKLSIHKMRAVEDPEHFLRRSVLINNTMKRLQRELREEKLRGGPRRAAAACYSLYRHRGPALHYDVLNNSYLLHDEAFAVSEHDRITDDMTDALVTRLEATSTVSSTTTTTSVAPESSSAAVMCDSDDVFAVSPLLPDTTSSISSSPPSPSSSCSSESQRGKQFFSDMDVVFNNLIRALGES
ncbi:uncharacterized protein LOC112570005 isoform X2 [Pomacea canaliculata]|uniref:uncharacterized protein LOC112570005 isoform X2 n=1 Tax=Pomacea canaliculata TaxID=400727 RepID=UPI000D735477|nr:uncharacterized protein LOC112570005 isoform X2 [Pomacea canaliculata]